MNILARRLVWSPPLAVAGVVTLNGEPRPAHWKAAYVQQDDLLFGSLTVEETLRFTAGLRLPQGTSVAAQHSRVAAVLAALGLEMARATRVGGVGQRGVSGGERKARRRCMAESVAPAHVDLLTSRPLG